MIYVCSNRQNQRFKRVKGTWSMFLQNNYIEVNLPKIVFVMFVFYPYQENKQTSYFSEKLLSKGFKM